MPVGDHYRFVVTDLNDVELAEVPAQNPTWSDVLNESGACSFAMPARHPLCNRTLFALNKAGLHIYYDQALIWGGHLYNAQGNAEGDVRFGFSSYFERVKRRYVDVSQRWTNTDISDIAWGLISFTQGKTNGNLGMNWSRGASVTTGSFKDAAYPFWERKSIGDAIIDLSELSNGFDFDVTPFKVFRVYYPSRGSVLTIPMEYGKNIQTFALTEDGTDTANTYSAIGAGDGKNTCIAVAGAPTQQAAYGLLEDSESFSDITHFSPLQDAATEGLRAEKDPRIQPSVTLWPTPEPLPTQFNVGDRLPVICNDGYYNFNQTLRIISKVVAMSNEGRAAITYQFDDLIDV